MEIREYTKFVRDSTYAGGKYWYAALGIAGESGEVVDEVKKIMRDDGGEPTDKRLEKIKLELGDVMWYIFRLSLDLGLDVSDILDSNVTKLKDRRKNGKKAG